MFFKYQNSRQQRCRALSHTGITSGLNRKAKSLSRTWTALHRAQARMGSPPGNFSHSGIGSSWMNLPFSIQRGRIWANQIAQSAVDSCVKPTSTPKGERRRLQVGPHGTGSFFWSPQLLPSALLLLRLTEGCNFHSRNRDSRASSSHRRREKHSWDWMSHTAGAGMDDTPCTHTDTHRDGADPSGPWMGQWEQSRPRGRCPEPLRCPRSKEPREGKIGPIPQANKSYQTWRGSSRILKRGKLGAREGLHEEEAVTSGFTRGGGTHYKPWRCRHNHLKLAITWWLHPAAGTTPAKTALSFVQLRYF